MAELPISMDDSKVTPVEAQADQPVAERQLREVRCELLNLKLDLDRLVRGEATLCGFDEVEAIKAMLASRPTPAAADLHQQSHSVHLAGDETGRTSVEGGVNAPSAEVPEHFIAQLRDASRYLLQNGQTKQGLAVQACITMLEDDSE